MVNFRIVSKIIGQLLFLESAFMLFSLAVAFYYNEDDIMAFLISMIATVGSGLIFRYFGRNSTNNWARRRRLFRCHIHMDYLQCIRHAAIYRRRIYHQFGRRLFRNNVRIHYHWGHHT